MNRQKNRSGQNSSLPSGATLALAGALLVTAVATPACKQKPWERDVTFTEGRTFAGEVEVTAATLNDGRDAYMLYCYACHGEKGDGKGPSSYGLKPQPRDFTRGVFKFARVRGSDEMPNDEDMERIVLGGLHGTAMLPWDIPKVELHAILQYIKTFAALTEDGQQDHATCEADAKRCSKWQRVNKKGNHLKVVEPWEPEADPWAGKEQEAILRGKELYHLRAECANCHPGYDTKEELYKMSIGAAKRQPDVFSALKGVRDDFYHSQAKKSEEYTSMIMPPDFTMDQLRSAHGLTEDGKSDPETRVKDIYRILAFGVYPIMPAWKGAGLSTDEIYALAHYVKSLVDMRGKPAAIELHQRMNDQKAFEIPKPEEAKPAEQPADQAGDKKEGDQATDKKDEKKPEDAKKDEKKPEDAKKEEPKKDEPKK